MYMATKNFYNYWQTPEDTLTTFLEQLNNCIDVLKNYFGKIREDLTLLKDQGHTEVELASMAENVRAAVAEKARTKYLAYAFLFKADNKRFSGLKEDLQNDCTKKQKLIHKH